MNDSGNDSVFLAITQIAAFHGIDTNLSKLKREFGKDSETNILRAAKSLGLRARSLRYKKSMVAGN